LGLSLPALLLVLLCAGHRFAQGCVGSLVWQDAALLKQEKGKGFQLKDDGLSPRKIDAEAASGLLKLLDDPCMPQGKLLRIERALASGGPWFPALVGALGNGGKTSRTAAKVLMMSLDKRPLLFELPRPGEQHISVIDPFNSSRARQGIALYFPGTWPGPVTLGDFLEGVNEEAAPNYPFVLRPDLGADSSLVIRGKPLEGAAPLVLDRVLSKFGLGVTFLESIAMVEPGGKSTFGQTAIERKPDALLLEGALSVLNDPEACDGSRRAAFKAMAYLDLPGLFDGYLLDLREKRFFPALDILLFGPFYPRLGVACAVEEDGSTLAALLRAGFGHQADARLRKRIRGLLFSMSRDLVSGTIERHGMQSEAWTVLFVDDDKARDNAILAMIESPDPDVSGLGLEAARAYAPSRPDLGGWLIKRFFERPLDRPWRIRLPRYCIEDAVLWRFNDEEIAHLIRNDETRTAGMELAKAMGGRASCGAVVDLVNRGQGGVAAVETAAGIIKRLGRTRPEDRFAGLIEPLSDRSVSDGVLVCRAGLFAALSPDDEDLGQAADILLGAIGDGGETGLSAAAMLSYFTDGRIIEYLEQVQELTDDPDPVLAEELERAVLRSAGGSSLCAERIRLALVRFKSPDLWEGAIRRLGLLSSLTSLDSCWVAVDF